MQPESTTVKSIVAESAIEEWRQWQVKLPGKPEMVQPLGKGLSNQSYLLKAGDSHLVLRINNSAGQLPGIDRQREATIWRAACQAGIAPALLHAEDRYLVSSFVAGEGHGAAPTDEVFRLLEQCHAIKIDTPQLDYAQHIQTYWSRIEHLGLEHHGLELAATAPSGNEQTGQSIVADLTKQRQLMWEFLNALSAQPQESVLCHHDPVMANFVGSPNRLYLIDWEYAAKGLAVMDYAALAVEWGFSDATICARTNIRLDSLVMAKKLYRYMCQLWAAAQSEEARPRK